MAHIVNLAANSILTYICKKTFGDDGEGNDRNAVANADDNDDSDSDCEPSDPDKPEKEDVQLLRGQPNDPTEDILTMEVLGTIISPYSLIVR